MSIKEHLAQHEGKPDRLHGLTLESEDRQELKFDVKRDISPEDWNAMQTQLIYDRTSLAWESFADLASRLRLLDPSRDLGITDTDWESMQTELDSDRSAKQWRGFAYLASSLRLLDPSRDLGITESAWDAMRSRLDSKRSSNDWRGFAYLASSLRLLDPSHDLGITESDWNAMRAELDSYRSFAHNWQVFADLAASLRILAAHDVRITAPGKIAITDRAPDLHTKTPPRPERKAT